MSLLKLSQQEWKENAGAPPLRCHAPAQIRAQCMYNSVNALGPSFLVNRNGCVSVSRGSLMMVRCITFKILVMVNINHQSFVMIILKRKAAVTLANIPTRKSVTGHFSKCPILSPRDAAFLQELNAFFRGHKFDVCVNMSF